ncbi:acyltransferase family protein [Neorhodopirellula lusitana]|uniref:acyltransferase family protein n=1 Tax=Neorhodopirellula lusitana TaxID=445327 RepID=UPI00384EB49C
MSPPNTSTASSLPETSGHAKTSEHAVASNQNEQSLATKPSWWDRPKNAITALDGLRAIAILLVIGRHGVRPFWGEQGFLSVAGWDLGTPMHNGWMGVDLFFVLSGFLITIHILRRYGTEFTFGHLADYGRRRAYRIVPAYVAAIVVAISGLVPFFVVADENLAWRVGYHLLFLQDYLPANIVVVFWSLGVEEKFYLITPFALMAILRLQRRQTQYLCLLGILVLPILFRMTKVQLGTVATDYEGFFHEFRSPFHLTFDGLAMGVLTAFIYLDKEKWSWTQNPRIANAICWSGIGIFSALLFCVPLLEEVSLFDITILQSLVAIASAAILLGLVLGGGPVKLLSGKQLFAIGKLSYSWYLVHLMTIPMSIWIAQSVLGSAELNLTVFVVFAGFYVPLSFAFAVGLHTLVERPFLALRDHRANAGVTSQTTNAHSPVVGNQVLQRTSAMRG